MKLNVVLHPDEEDGGFIASCPALPGCHSQGETREEALANLREAIDGVLETLNARAVPLSGDQLVEVEV